METETFNLTSSGSEVFQFMSSRGYSYTYIDLESFRTILEKEGLDKLKRPEISKSID